MTDDKEELLDQLKQVTPDDKPWTKKELSLRVGYKELAMAVVEQWKADGKPEAELISFWIDVLTECQKEVSYVH